MHSGSNIKLDGEHKGTGKHVKYKWIAHAQSNTPTVIYLNKEDAFWPKLRDKRMIRELVRVCSHEPIHNLLWRMGIDGKYDYLVHKFRKQVKKECPKTYREYRKF